MRVLLLLSVVFLGCVKAAPAANASAPVTTVFVVRHAEKAAEPKADPPLTEAGAARAELLINALNGQSLGAAFSTDFQRTRETASPAAARFGLTTELVDARAKDHVQQVASAVLTKHRGETVLVVGHSNTVPDIVAALGAPRPGDICDAEFDWLFVVRVPASGPSTVEQRRYGARTEDESCRAK